MPAGTGPATARVVGHQNPLAEQTLAEQNEAIRKQQDALVEMQKQVPNLV